MSDAAPPTPLHKLYCASCERPIRKGSQYCQLRMPDGTTAPVHLTCLAGNGKPAAPPPCPTIDEARELALAWARGQEPDPALLVWVRAFMLDRWGGEPIGSALTTGQAMAWAVGQALCILLEVSPAGSGGVLPLCEAAGWPRHPEPGEDPLPPLR